jgi:ABC-type nitrate/sulfonate/bicarbonate transport system permease component
MGSVGDDRRTVWGGASASTAATQLRASVTAAGPAAVVFIGVVVSWHAATVVFDVPTVILPSPLDVATTLRATLPLLLADGATTAVTAALGLLAGTVCGLVLAFGMVSSRAVEAVVHPYIVALRIAPLVALAPLVFLWFGRGVPARALLVTTLTVFPVTISSVGGLRAVPREYLDVGRSVAASRRQLFVRIRVPAAAPSIFAGVKLAGALSVVGTVVAEFVTLSSGLGYRVFVSSTNLQTSRAYAALVVLVGIGLWFYLLPARLERLASHRR